MSSMFIGMSTGALLASYAFAHRGWSGGCGLGADAAVAALGVRSLPTG